MSEDQLLSPKRCAIYTRKSTSSLPDREISSLETQREICGAYIRSQQIAAGSSSPSTTTMEDTPAVVWSGPLLPD